LTRAIELREAALGPDHPLVAQALNSLGVAMIFEGDLLGAREALGRVLEIRRATLGPDHDLVGGALNNIAYTYFMGDEWTDAVDYYGHSLEIREQTLGPSSTKVAEILMDRGWSLHGLGRDAEARADLERSIAIFDARPEHNHDELGCQSPARLAVVLDALGDPAAAGVQRAGGCRDENGVDR
jgi:serine/threonine-protein kinase